MQYLNQPHAQLPGGFQGEINVSSFSSAGTLQLHSQLLKQGNELVTSRLHRRSRSRVSYYVLLQLTDSHQRVADVLYYVRVQPLFQCAQAAPLRLAVCKVFSTRARRGELHVADPSNLQ